ncbi:MAG: hypothetical protein ACRCSU_04620 [Paracoccaceae bacterium]
MGHGIRRAHRLIAVALAAFLVLHIGNHLALLGGTDAHIAVQAVLRPLYRWLPVEALLLGLFAAQILLGLALTFRRGWPRSGWARAQVISGLYLAFFLVQHVPAVLTARFGADAHDTTVHFAAAPLSVAPFHWYFMPYYTLSVVALLTHFAAMLHFRGAGRGITLALPVLGLLTGVVIVAGLMGAFGGPDVPQEYRAWLLALRP